MPHTLLSLCQGHHGTPILDVAYDTSGELIATGAADSLVRCWDSNTGAATHNFKVRLRHREKYTESIQMAMSLGRSPLMQCSFCIRFRKKKCAALFSPPPLLSHGPNEAFFSLRVMRASSTSSPFTPKLNASIFFLVVTMPRFVYGTSTRPPVWLSLRPI